MSLRLIRKQIYPQDVHQIQKLGKVNLFFFDKTRTLTNEDHLIRLHQFDQDIAWNMLTCLQQHSDFSIVNIDQYLNSHIQNIFDIQMVKRFDYSFQSETQSFIVYDNQSQQHFLFCYSQANQNTDNDQIYELIAEGFKYINFWFRKLDQDDLDQSREQLERNLSYAGVVVLQNDVKEDAKKQIKDLNKTKIQCKIISGDNPLQSIYCAYICQMISDEIILLDFDRNQITARIVKQLNQTQSQEILKEKEYLSECLVGDSQFAITGRLLDYYEKLSSEVIKNQDILDHLQSVILSATVYCQMQGEQKKKIVMMYQKIANKCVAMVGDGVNDYSALNAADIGISPCQSEGSIISQISIKEISDLKQLISEGKGLMSVLVEIFDYLMIINILDFIVQQIVGLQDYQFNSFEVMYLKIKPTVFYYIMGRGRSDLNSREVQDNVFKMSNQFTIYNQLISNSLGLIILAVWNGQNNQLISLLFLGLSYQSIVISVQIYNLQRQKERWYKNKVLGVGIMIEIIWLILKNEVRIESQVILFIVIATTSLGGYLTQEYLIQKQLPVSTAQY